MKQKRIVTYDTRERNPSQNGVIGVIVRHTDLPNTIERILTSNNLNHANSCWENQESEQTVFSYYNRREFTLNFIPLTPETYDKIIIKTHKLRSLVNEKSRLEDERNKLKDKAFDTYKPIEKQEAFDIALSDYNPESIKEQSANAKDNYFSDF
jgi:hypothetical protein